jgi:hypothetical protein
MITNGMKVTDIITGFTGTVTGIVSYISGCNQALVAPPLDAKGEVPESKWFDLQRLQQVPGSSILVLDNGAQPGFDKSPPTR